MTHRPAPHPDHARMLICCPDQPGILAAVSQFLFAQGANIVHSDQHTTDPMGGNFFMRIEFDLPNLPEHFPALQVAFDREVAEPRHMDWRITSAAQPKRIAIFVTKEEHCLFELLWQQRQGDLAAEIVRVISNHNDLRSVVETWGIPFHHIPVTKESKREAEAAQLALLHDIDLVVLARYMQLISPNFLEHFNNRIINIHHSFLPAFVGANPYLRAHQRGVKLIGATAHYVTPELDAGPIIEQDVHRVDHSHTVDDLRRIGRHIEREVLARAVAWHCEDRILVSENKTVVFV